ncbi:MAG: MFS transporter [Dissulfuribacterales bacterium]
MTTHKYYNIHALMPRIFKDQKLIFLFSTFLGAVAAGIFFSSLNNFLVDVYDMSADQRGVLETVREMPGMLLIVLLAPFSAVKEGKILFGATLVIALGIMGTASLSPDILTVTAWLFVWSVGAHMVMTIRESFCVALSEPGTRGRLFGIVRSLRSLGTILGATCIWLGMGILGFGYEKLYWTAALIALLSSLIILLIKEKRHTGLKRKRFVFKKKYSLFYLLAVLFGVRKQIFIVFGPWVLIRIFDQDAPAMARLILVSSIAGLFLKPYFGKLIDTLGERTVLIADSLILLMICACYGLAETTLPQPLILPCLFTCFILDDSLFSLRSAHITYLSKIVESEDELTASISTSYSIEHVVSMIAPIIAGLVWIRFGYPWVFFMSALVAGLMFLASAKLPRKASF